MKPVTAVPLLALLFTCACQDGHDAADPLLPACSPESVPVTLSVPVTGGSRPVRVELALTETQRSMGLMNRTHLDADAGMLFIFAADQPLHFWMKNTLIPLDIVFLDADGTVQNIAEAQPYVEQPGYSALRWGRMVLELNQGWSREHGLVPGAKIPIPAELLPLAKP
jgi:uncharacterized protein